MESQCFGFFCKKFNLEMKFLNYCDNDHGFLTLIHHHWIFILKCSSVLQVLNNLPVIWSTELFVDPFWLTKKPFDFEQKVVSESSGVYTIHHYQMPEILTYLNNCITVWQWKSNLLPCCFRFSTGNSVLYQMSLVFCSKESSPFLSPARFFFPNIWIRLEA